MKRLIIALMLSLTLLTVMVGTALAAGNTIRVTGNGVQRNCVELPHAAGTGAGTAHANSDAIDRTHTPPGHTRLLIVYRSERLLGTQPLLFSLTATSLLA